MKKRVMLPLVAAISTAMVGCGGGGGDSGGSNGPSPKSYTFQFVQMEINKSPTNLPSNCNAPTIFKEYSNGNIDYAKIVSGNVDIHAYNSDGTFDKDLTNKLNASTGAFTFTVNDVPDGGYITVFDNLGSSSSPVFHTLSIQKELLTDLLINVESLQGNRSSCFTDGKLVVDSQLKKAALGSADPSLLFDSYSVESFIDGYKSNSANIKESISTVNSNEQVLFTGLTVGDVVASRLVKAGNFVNSGMTNVELKTLLHTVPVSLDITASQVLTSSYALGYTDSTAFKWQSLPVNTAGFKFDEELAYSALLEGNESGWSIVSNTILDKNIGMNDVDLSDAVIASAINPEVNSCSSGCVVDTKNAVDSNKFGFQRSYFEASEQSKHTIYSTIPTNSETIIPQYSIDGLQRPSDGVTPEVSFVLTSDTVDADFIHFAMSKYNDPGSTASFVDKVSILSLPSDSLAAKRGNASLQYEVIEK